MLKILMTLFGVLTGAFFLLNHRHADDAALIVGCLAFMTLLTAFVVQRKKGA